MTVIKIGRYRDDGIRDFFSQIIFSGFFDVGQDVGRNFRRAVQFALQTNSKVAIVGFFDFIGQHRNVLLNFRRIILAPDETFYTKNRVLGVGNRLSFGNLPHQSLTVI